MKLIVTLLVRDEADIIDVNLRYHLSQGVDHVIVTDNLSVDGTPDILAAYEARGLVTVIREERDDYSQAQWVTRMAKISYQEYGADWVINSDADEFWWPQEGDLKSTLTAMPGDVGMVQAQRSNFLPVPNDGRSFYSRMVVREVESMNALGAPLPGKVCHRGHSEIQVLQGNHGVHGVHLEAYHGPPPLVIFHFPLRSYPQFENKIVKGGRAYERNSELEPAVGETWRYLYRLCREGGLRDYYRRREMTETEIAEALEAGSVVEDLRLKEYLEALEVEGNQGGDMKTLEKI